VAGGIGVWVVAWLTVYLLGGDARRPALLAAAGALVVCYPAHIPEVSNYLTAGLFPLLFQMDRFLPYIPLAAVVGWLARRRASPEEVAGQDLVLGPVLLALYLVGASGRIFWVPVPLIAGFLLARYWLFRKPAGGLEANASEQLRAQRIKELIDWRWTARMARVFRRAQDKKLEKGELTLEQHQKLLADFQAGAGEAATTQPRVEISPRDLALASGPTGNSWSDAGIAVRYGLPLALPWVALTLYEFVATRQELAFPLPHFAVEVLVALVRWLAVAFVFGYFYRYLRGSSGLSKGLALWAAIVTPFLLLWLLLTEPLAGMRYFFYWAGQVFVFCTVLGVAAFDYETLRRNGYSWRHLTALHNVPALSAFGSSLAAVLIPALIALFQGKVADLMKFVVGSVLPKLPPAGQ
ncbi:MAG: hypothetical protein HY822_01875, partial [Acidobacteria bacterium]|nr:hypothetical protein [Acidobacteriota bacterium]